MLCTAVAAKNKYAGYAFFGPRICMKSKQSALRLYGKQVHHTFFGTRVAFFTVLVAFVGWSFHGNGGEGFGFYRKATARQSSQTVPRCSHCPPFPPCNKWGRDQWRWRRIPTHRSRGHGLQPQAALEQRPPPPLPALPLQRVLQAMIVPFVRDLRATSSPTWGPPDGSLFASTPFWGGPRDGRRHPLSLLVGWAVVHQPWNTI